MYLCYEAQIIIQYNISIKLFNTYFYAYVPINDLHSFAIIRNNYLHMYTIA